MNLFGLPMSGKDTQAKVLAELLNAPVIGGGDIIRNSQDEALKSHVGRGVLAPTEVYLAMILPYFAKPEFDNKALVLSIVGRWSGEEVSVVKALKASKHDLKAVVYLKVSEDEVIRRWEAHKAIGDRGDRADDTREALDVRLEEFRTKTLPVIEYYREAGLLIEIEGNQSHDDVTKDILEALLSRASASP